MRLVISLYTRIQAIRRKEASGKINYPLYWSEFPAPCGAAIGFTGFKVALTWLVFLKSQATMYEERILCG